MRTVLGYIDGKPQWSENVPAAAISGTIRGGLVQSGPPGESLYIPTAHEAKKAKARAERDRIRRELDAA